MGAWEGSGVVDCRVGTVVWVRRRNGTWWPGRIMGQNELSSSNLTSPRSGTPVKLLGREDGSVDWYNLEKSKRVKAFRCGEFDDCIERAEYSLGNSSKNIEKYARREDAIIHALEIEKQQMEKKHKELATKPRNLGRYGVEGHPGNMNREEHDEPDYLSHLSSDDQTEAGVEGSKWKLKGKWNTRNLTKRPGDVVDRKSSNRSIHGTHLERNGINFSLGMSGQDFFHDSAELSHGYDEGRFIDKEFETHMVGFGNRGYSVTLDAASKDHSRIGFDSESENELILETNGLSQSASGYWEGKDSQFFDPVYIGRHDRMGTQHDRMGTALIDVDLKVQASYRRVHVPLISLMSRLNGKAIIGHPIQIEALPHGSSNTLLPRKDDNGNDLFDNDGNAVLQPVWRTSKRTSVHYVPLPHPSSALEDDENAHGFQNSGHLGDKARQNSFSPTHKFLRKPLKNASLSNQKRRTLSSFSTEHKLSGKGDDPKPATQSCMMDALIKPEETAPPTVTCIPVKLAFSRLLEAVGRSPSRA